MRDKKPTQEEEKLPEGVAYTRQFESANFKNKKSPARLILSIVVISGIGALVGLFIYGMIIVQNL